MAVGHQGGGVRIDDGAVAEPQAFHQYRPEFVVSRLEAPELCRLEAPEEGPQGVSVREIGQAQQGRDQSIVDQRLNVLDPTDASDDSEEVCQKQIRRMIRSVPIVRPADIRLQETFEAQRFAKLVKEKQSTVPGQPGGSEEKLKFSRSSGHPAESYQKGRFVQYPISRREKA
jgi:hypothetical protein